MSESKGYIVKPLISISEIKAIIKGLQDFIYFRGIRMGLEESMRFNEEIKRWVSVLRLSGSSMAPEKLIRSNF